VTGQTIKDYTLGNILGKGGMATVYLALNNKFNTHVAVKVLSKEFVHNENIRSRFLAEARKMYIMSHPNIIKVTDLIDDGDLVAFVMEYAEGQTLKDYLDLKGGLSEPEIKRLFSQMLTAVGYVHEQGFVHRDIKPSNFIISKKGDVKLLDFGIAKNTDATAAEYTMTGTTQNMGTPMYMSPEQIKSSKDVLAPSDIYSLGVLLWQMVTGKKPYDLQTLSTFDIQLKIVNESLSLTGTGYDAIIKKATQKEISDRFPDISGFQQAFKDLDDQSEKTQILQNISIAPTRHTATAIETQVLQQNSNTLSKRNIRWIAGIVVLLGIITASYFLFLKKSRNDGRLNEKDAGELKQSVVTWSTALNDKNLSGLEALYNSSLIYYRLYLARDAVLERVSKFFANNPGSYQQIPGEIEVRIDNNDTITCSFIKNVTLNGKTTDYPSYLRFLRQTDGWKIVEEGDKVTDKNLVKQKSKASRSGAASYLDNNGKLVFRTDCYVIITGSFSYESDAKNDVQRIRNEGYSNAGYLWIPDYPSLSGKEFYAPFIGPFQTYDECERNLRSLSKTGRFWYGVKVSYDNARVEIR
jgi:serine/threonine protein kinase